MPVDRRDRTISYRRAEWFIADPKSISLEMSIRQTCEKLTNVNERTLIRTDGQYVSIVSAKTEDRKGLLLHIATDTPGESASIVPARTETKDEIDVSTVAPPEDFEFMDGDAFLYVIHTLPDCNSVIVCRRVIT